MHMAIPATRATPHSISDRGTSAYKTWTVCAREGGSQRAGAPAAPAARGPHSAALHLRGNPRMRPKCEVEHPLLEEKLVRRSEPPDLPSRRRAASRSLARGCARRAPTAAGARGASPSGLGQVHLLVRRRRVGTRLAETRRGASLPPSQSLKSPRRYRF